MVEYAGLGKMSRKTLERIVKDQLGHGQYVYHFVNPGLRMNSFQRTTENGRLILKQ